MNSLRVVDLKADAVIFLSQRNGSAFGSRHSELRGRHSGIGTGHSHDALGLAVSLSGREGVSI